MSATVALDPGLVRIRLATALQAGESRRIGFSLDAGLQSLDELSLYAGFDTLGTGLRYHLATSVVAVPEPAGALLLGGGGLLLWLGRRRVFAVSPALTSARG